MVFLLCVHGASAVSPWCPNGPWWLRGGSMVLPWGVCCVMIPRCPHGALMVSPWCLRGGSMVGPRWFRLGSFLSRSLLCRASMLPAWCLLGHHGAFWFFHGVLMVLLWRSCGGSMMLPWFPRHVPIMSPWFVRSWSTVLPCWVRRVI